MKSNNHHITITEGEALNACLNLIDEYEEGMPLSDIRIQFAKRMFSLLSIEYARIIADSYPFRSIVTTYDIYGIL